MTGQIKHLDILLFVATANIFLHCIRKVSLFAPCIPKAHEVFANDVSLVFSRLWRGSKHTRSSSTDR